MSCEDNLVFVGVKPLGVDASVADDVAEGFGDVSSSAAMVTVDGAAVQQVLWTQGDEDAGSLRYLPLESPQRAEGPARPAQALLKRGRQSDHVSRLRFFLRSCSADFLLGSARRSPGPPSSSRHSEASLSRSLS